MRIKPFLIAVAFVAGILGLYVIAERLWGPMETLPRMGYRSGGDANLALALGIPGGWREESLPAPKEPRAPPKSEACLTEAAALDSGPRSSGTSRVAIVVTSWACLCSFVHGRKLKTSLSRDLELDITTSGGDVIYGV